MKFGKRILMYGIPKSFLFKIILFLLILLFGRNVFAQEYNVTNSITAPSGSGSTGGHYLGLEIYNSGSQNNYTVNTRYIGTLSEIIYNLPLPTEAGQCFTTNMDYTITMEMATDDWRNHFTSPFVAAYSTATNWSSSGVTFVSMKKIYFKFKIPSTETSCVDFVFVRLRSSSLANTAFTGTTNWKLSKITLSDLYSSSGGGSSGGGSSGSGSGSTSNTNQDIINNNNENTENIIENNNQNTQQIIDSLNNKCPNMLNYNAYYRNYGSNITVEGDTLTLQSSNAWNWTVYDFPLDTGKRYYLKGSCSSNDANTSPLVWVTYDNDDWNDRTFVYEQSGNFNYSFVAQHDHIYIRLYASKDTGNTNYYYKVMFSDQDVNYCPFGSSTNKIDETTNAINDVNDTLNNDNVDSGTGSDFFNNFDTDDNGGISAIITKPLVLINSLLSNNNSCSNLSFSIGFPNHPSKTVSFPSGCILWDSVPSTVVNIYHMFIVGFCSYFLLKRLFKDVEDLKNPENDKVEVIDL